jgi:hypothetical protein
MTSWQHLRNGFRYGYPPCCAIWYALGHALGVRQQAVRRGVVVKSDEARFVPCCHFLHPQWRSLRNYGRR